VDAARLAGNTPRVHPNGFVQLDLEDSSGGGVPGAGGRFHVWPDNDSLPRQETVNTIHDHKFDMRSEIVCGLLGQVRYDVGLAGVNLPWEIYVAKYSCRHQSVLHASGVRVNVHACPVTFYGPGEVYVQPAGTFHDTQARGLAATIMTKTGEHEHDPRVLCLVGQPPDNSFIRGCADEGVMWNFIERALL
jgi:hypothetical protein